MSKGFWSIKRYLTEIRVGLFFVVGIIAFLGIIFSVRELTFFKGTYILKVEFDFAEGLRPASPVRFCGVDVGEVKNVEITKKDDRPTVVVYAKIQNDINIPRGSYFFINSLSLFGEKYLEITPPAEGVSGYLVKDDTVVGLSPIPLFNVFVTFNKTMKEISDFVKEGKIKTSFENTMSNMEAISAKINSLIDDMKNKEGTIGRFLYDDSLYQKTEEFVEDLKNNPWKLLYKPKEKNK